MAMLAAIASPLLHAGGPLGIDHRVTFDESGVWNRNVQIGMLGALVAGETAGALWEGGDSRLGMTLWKSIDATALTGVAAYAMKYAFSRQRPLHTTDPGLWFQGGGNASFPSGEVALSSAIVMPLLLEYGKERPAILALALLPLYDAVARVKVQEHWQSDVIAGLVLGSSIGYLMQHREKPPFILGALPRGVYVGFDKRW
jgi:membrane-associated phospholipid phosphatase